MTELPSFGPRAARRLLLVHAHPDDESINNGATMAKYVAEGAQVTLVTCTLGERGESIPPGLRHLTGAALGAYRRGALAAAHGELGVTAARRAAARTGTTAQVIDARAVVLGLVPAGAPAPDLPPGPHVQLWPHVHGTDAMHLTLLRRD